MTFLFVRDGREYVLSPGETLETDLGVLEVPDDVSPGETVETHLGEPFSVRALRPPDYFDHFERTGAPMLPRDIGLVLGATGIGTGDRVLDAGTGTGVLAAYCASAGAEVETYERDPDFAATARQNMELAGLTDRVTVRTDDICDALATITTPVDVVTLDTADAPAVVESVPDILRSNGFLAVYSPFVEDARAVAATAREVGLNDIETMETIQRAMDFDDRGSRPSTRGVGHTGYLTFARN